MTLVVAGGKVRTGSGWTTTDVIIEEGRISAMGGALEAAEVVDARGCLVGPGFVDLHAHLRDPGQTWKEDIGSGSRAAAAGGYAAIVVMPNTEPPIDSVDLVSRVRDAGRMTGLVDVVAAGSLTAARAGAVAASLEALYAAGVRIFTDDGDPVLDVGLLEEIMSRLAGLDGAVVAQHAEDTARTRDGHMNEGALSRRLRIGGLPAAAETDVVIRDIELVRKTGARYHCQHVSSKMTVDVIRKAKSDSLPVTAEVTPHHLIFDESSLDTLDPDFKMYPPLRSADDRAALIEALTDGTIDAVATDHAPHTVAEKAVPFSRSPRGVIGLETAAAAVWEVLDDDTRFFDVMATAPARIAGLEPQGAPLAAGAAANIVVFDPSRRWVPSVFASKSSNSPFRGRDLTGAVMCTIHHGSVVYRRESE